MARAKFLVDAERCIECNACVTACKNEHEVPWGINRRKVTTLPLSLPNTVATASQKVNCRSAQRCVPQKHYWLVTETSSRASTVSVSWRAALDPVPGGGEPPMTRRAADLPPLIQ